MTVDIADIFKSIDNLPNLPVTVVKIIELTNKAETTAVDLNDIISHDQVMAAKILRLANSACYGFPRRITTITQAVVVLGFNVIRSLAIAASTADILSRQVAGYRYQPKDLWRHSMGCAVVARQLARKTKYRNVEEAFTAGLLHDIGKVVLQYYVEADFVKVLEAVEQQNLSFNDAEKSVLGFTHPEAGGMIGEKWNMPEKLVEAIKYHHEPEKAIIDPNLAAIIHLADALCLMIGCGLAGDGLMYSLNAETLNLLGINEADLDMIIDDTTNLLIDSEAFMTI